MVILSQEQWTQLIAEHRTWELHNFPAEAHSYSGSITGVIEELGELAHSHLKEQQAIRGSSEEHVAAGKDAIGDMMVYSLGILFHLHMVPNMKARLKVLETMKPERMESTRELHQLANHVGQLANEPGTFVMDRVIGGAAKYCRSRDWDFGQIVLDTWTQVSKRDWIADPLAGKIEE